MSNRNRKSTPIAKLSRQRSFSVESLEDRRMMAGNTVANLAPIYGPLPAYAVVAPAIAANPGSPTGVTPPVGPAAPPVADNVLNGGWTQEGAYQVLNIDGSDYDDVVKVTNYTQTGANSASVTVELEQWLNGSKFSTQTMTYRTNKSAPIHPSLQVRVNGKGGNDVIDNLSAAGMSANGGDGNDLIYGGNANDNLTGGNGLNTMYGRGGADIMYGGDDSDHMNGGDGDDTMTGGKGNDTLYGNAGVDSLSGQADDDFLYGDNGNDDANIAYIDYLYGGLGNDRLYGDAGNDVMQGEIGMDDMFGGRGADTMNGGDGDDTMHGGADGDHMGGDSGVDTLYGDAGNDFLDGGFMSGTNINSPDKIYGGLGADQFTRHKTTWGSDDADVFFDYLASSGDTINNSWHF